MDLKILTTLLLLFGVFGSLQGKSELTIEAELAKLKDIDEIVEYTTKNLVIPHKKKLQEMFTNMISYGTEIRPQADFIDEVVCPLAVPLVKLLVRLGIPDATIIGAIIGICEGGNIAPHPDLCEPTIRSYAEPVLYIVKNKPELTMRDFCGILNPGHFTVSARLTNWTTNVDANKPTQNNPPLPGNLTPTKILQLTDVHLDLDYVEGTSADCILSPSCCRIDSVAKDPDSQEMGGPYGHFGCPLPMKGLEALLDHAKTEHSDIKYIFLTGDYIHSGVWLYSVPENTRHIKNVTKVLKDAFPTTKIYPVTGNHETDVVNMYPPQYLKTNLPQYDLEWMYAATIELFEENIPENQRPLFRRAGYYTVSPETGFRLVILNTNLCYINNFWLAFDPIDPEGQLQWFADTMLTAEAAGEAVYIVGHIQPGSGSCWPVWSRQFDLIIQRFEAIIKAQFYGHSHTDYFTLAFETGTQKPISTAYVSPSGVTDSMNSGYKLFYADGERGPDSTWEILNFQTWILNLTQSNTANLPVMEMLYDARVDFGLTSFRPDALYDFVYRMIDDDALFQKYIRAHYKGDGPRLENNRCDNQRCKCGYLCELVESISGSYNNHCAKILQALNIYEC